MGTGAEMGLWQNKLKAQYVVGGLMAAVGFYWHDTALIVAGGGIMVAPAPKSKEE